MSKYHRKAVKLVKRYAPGLPFQAPFQLKYKHMERSLKVKTYPQAGSRVNKVDYARLSMASYEKFGKRNVTGYTIDESLSNKNRVVYMAESSGEVVIAFRGTNVKDWRDVTTDALLAFSGQKESSRFKNARKVTEQAIAKYGKERVTVTGHSLGGSQALWVSNKLGVKAHAYNPHVTAGEVLSGASFPNATIHMNLSDPISAGSMFVPTGGGVEVKYDISKGPFLGQHGISNFTEKPIEKRPSSPVSQVRYPSKAMIK